MSDEARVEPQGGAAEAEEMQQLKDDVEMDVDESQIGSGLTADGKLRPWGERMVEVLVNMGPLGLIAFGGPAAHIGVLQNQFVEKKRWLDSEKFVELMAVGQGLPGPTSTQMVVSIGAMRAGIGGGLLAFTLWNLPSFIVLVTVASLSREYLDADTLPDWLKGLPAAATSLVFLAAYNLGMKVLVHPNEFVQKLKLALATLTAVTTILVTADHEIINPRLASAVFPALLILGGLITLAHSRRPGKLEHYFVAPSQSEEDENNSILRHINISPYVGALLIVLWLGVLVSVVSLRAVGAFDEDGLLALFETFFRIGSIIYGGGQVVLPMLLPEVVDTNWVSKPQFFQGFALVQSLPGPLFNFSSFLGAIHLGIPGAFVAWAGLFGPGVILILAFLPFWMKVRRVAWFKCFLAGVNASAIGLIVAACPQLYFAAVTDWASVAVFLFTGSIIRFFDVFVPLGVLLGGLLGFLLSPTGVGFAQSFAQNQTQATLDLVAEVCV